jgi:hypothetical protein
MGPSKKPEPDFQEKLWAVVAVQGVLLLWLKAKWLGSIMLQSKSQLSPNSKLAV